MRLNVSDQIRPAVDQIIEQFIPLFEFMFRNKEWRHIAVVMSMCRLYRVTAGKICLCDDLILLQIMKTAIFKILSCDHKEAITRVANSVGIGDVHVGLKPQDNFEVIRQYQSQDLTVMLVGDINDALALASSQVGVAMGIAGTDVAVETADIALTHVYISKLPWLLRLSERKLKIIRSGRRLRRLKAIPQLLAFLLTSNLRHLHAIKQKLPLREELLPHAPVPSNYSFV